MQANQVLSLSVAAYTQAEIDELISCPKKFSESPRKDMKIEGAHARNDARLISDGIQGEFLMFMRRSEDFPENFSIGLVYHPGDVKGDITLLRCNGKHGSYNGIFDPAHPHYDFHIHKADASILAAGGRPERNATKTTAYASFEEAVQFFVRAINLNAAEATKYFPPKLQPQIPLWEG
jgi:hypothetical protein